MATDDAQQLDAEIERALEVAGLRAGGSLEASTAAAGGAREAPAIEVGDLAGPDDGD